MFLLMIAASASGALAPTARVVQLVPAAEESWWLLDQQLEVADTATDSGFAVGLWRGDDPGELTMGPRLSGRARGLFPLQDGHLAVLTPTRLLLLNARKPGWPREDVIELGLRDPHAAPAAAELDGELWVCWTSGRDILVRPLRQPEVQPRSLHKVGTGRVDLSLQAAGGALWLLVLEATGGEVTVISFVPGVESHEQGHADSAHLPQPEVTPEPEPELSASLGVARAAVNVKLREQAATGARAASLAVTERGPVVAVLPREGSSPAWRLKARNAENRTWQDLEHPPGVGAGRALQLSSYMSLSARQGRLYALYNEGAAARLAAADWSEGGWHWGEAEGLELPGGRGAEALLVWMVLFFAVLLLSATQAVWLFLNRESPADRKLLDTLSRRELKPADDAASRLVYAGALPRASALLIDVAVTSPLIILLQGYYEYTLSHAYGFLLIGSAEPLGASLMPMLSATLVTLIVLVIYSLFCELIWGRTFGKALFRLRVVDAQGEAPTPWRLVVRNLLKVVEMIHWTVLLLPMMVMMMSGKQQRLGDLAAGTYVIVDVVPDEAPDDVDVP
jgi:uncharacterized RDD family membrane protein YckC